MTKTRPYPDFNITISDSGRCVQASYSCPGLCKFALFEHMPPEDDDNCAANRNGDCWCPQASIAALKAAMRHLGKIVKAIEEIKE